MGGVKVEPVLLEGHPAAELIRYSREEKWISLSWAAWEKPDLTGSFWAALRKIWSGTQRYLFWL